jgi:fructose-1,6-bisphosphatase
MDDIITKQVKVLIELSQKKRNCLKKMFEYTEQQSEPIKNQNLEQLDKFIELKQKQIEIINQFDDEFNNNFSKLKVALGVDSIADASSLDKGNIVELQKYISEISDVIIKIQKLEQENSEIAKEIQKETKQKIHEFGDGRKIASSYKKIQEPPPVFFDKKK